ncbi:TetR/AcrR family transcriptional regulator [Mycolicibacterium sp. YH-1]|uniref:TetR/AcrR family transcriptional regulator n=1 Tax=Mycolicibacterium sp. YH-1 TaxID=2908837 RepID=UPI001F4C3AC9|nr:TetR/AcrR family transcriptional regulator [Mycolicibacterium sp. YH-1]UNB55755.1 TetR/AcrR family transcriptional regulator [Mycolicibacterium sp. YH-1]
MSPISAAPQRRRGSVLQDALLEATWAEIQEHGYDDLTFDAVAARAQTSRAVLYRRWPSKQDLVLAAVIHAVSKDPETAPDTGSLRGDVVGLLRAANGSRVRLATQLFTRLGTFYEDSGTNLAGLSAFVSGGRDNPLEEVIQRAIDRGEIQPEHVTDRIARLPADLFRYEVMFTLKPLPDSTIEEIVDTIFLPLIKPE